MKMRMKTTARPVTGAEQRENDDLKRRSMMIDDEEEVEEVE